MIITSWEEKWELPNRPDRYYGQNMFKLDCYGNSTQGEEREYNNNYINNLFDDAFGDGGVLHITKDGDVVGDMA
jgi:hypothetical protein